jgi:hypothetical protein
MADLSAIARELDALEELLTQIGAVTARQDDGRRYDLVQMRRKLAARIASVGQVSEPVFHAAGAGLAQDYRAKFSRMRSMAAMHQANWPAVMLVDDREDAFRASAQRMREANRDFIAWMREALTQLR